MRSIAIVIGLALSIALALWAQTPDKTKTTPKASKAKASPSKTTKSKGTTSSKSTASKTGGSKAATSKTSASKTGTSKTAVKKPATGKQSSKQVATQYRRSAQKEPAPERYKEIQQSLADKGYFAGPVNGAWGSDSVDALKRFQRDQNIGDDGKLGSLSLIALGLGPKRGTEKSENSEAGPTPP